MRLTIQDILKSACGHLNQHLVETVKKKKQSKYRNKKTQVDGIKFDSIKEANRYKELKLLQKAGEIGFLERQVVYELEVNNEKVCAYVADFVYVETKTGEKIVEDVKSEFTRKLPIYRQKKKLMKAIHQIEIKEV